MNLPGLQAPHFTLTHSQVALLDFGATREYDRTFTDLYIQVGAGPVSPTVLSICYDMPSLLIRLTLWSSGQGSQRELG